MASSSSKITCAICSQELNAFERLIATKQGDTYVCNNCRDYICRKEGVIPFENFKPWKPVLKIFFGLAFICSISYDDSIGTMILSVILGLALIAWAIVPPILQRSKYDAFVARELAKRTAVEETPHVCPSCGGISPGSYCEYCGRPFL